VLVPRYKLSLCHTPIKPDLLGFPGIGVFVCGLSDHVITRFASPLVDEDQPNTKVNHAKDPLKVPSGLITRARTNKPKDALNELVQNIWSKMNLDELCLRSMKDNL